LAESRTFCGTKLHLRRNQDNFRYDGAPSISLQLHQQCQFFFGGSLSSKMNISQPISSAITGVDFQFLSQEEIRAISVKRIISVNTWDNLGNPLDGGLYDLALGALEDSR
jgi:hypothetical protein